MSEAKKETTVVSTMTAAEYRRRIIRMVSSISSRRFLKMIYDFVYAFYLEDDCDPKPDSKKGGVQA